MTYVTLLSACAAGFIFGGLGASSAIAQIVPPPSTYKEWNGPSSGGSWDDSANWIGGLPSSGTWINEGYILQNPDADNALFGYKPVGGVVPALTDDAIRQTVDVGSSNRDLRSLWFKAGLWYTLSGTGQLWLGKLGPLDKDNYLLVVNPGDAGEQSEHTIEGFSHFIVHHEIERKQTLKIENWAEGGLGIFTDRIHIHDQIIQIGGTGATHFAGALGGIKDNHWKAEINVGLFQGTGDQPQPHFVLSGNNSGRRLEFRVNHRGFAIIKADQALGDQADEANVYAGLWAS